MNSHDYSRTGTLPPRFRELMQGCREMVRSHLLPLFQGLLENGDIALLEFASKAESNAMQSKFFEAMQDFKRKHDDIERAFHKSVDAGFRNFIEGTVSAKTSAENPEGKTIPKLSLVDKLEVEAALPVQNMIAKANANFSEQLYGLDQRLAVINGGSRLLEAALPAGPVLVAEAARGAFNLLDMDGKTRMVIYAVFDRYVMRELAGMYDEYNRRLVDAGILPNLKYEIRKQHDPRRVTPGPVPAPSGTVPKRSDGTAMAKSVGEEAFQAILEMMARGRGDTGTYAPGTVGSASGDVISDVVAATSRATILGAIHTIQHGYSDTESSARFHSEVIENIGTDKALLGTIRTTLEKERQHLYGGVDRRKVAGADADLIDLVGMLFEYMLQDERLPNAAKALLSRLHTPFLKVAIIDRQLFTEKNHPCRRLLDVMVEAGSKWVTEENLERGIFPSMRAVVERILRDFKDDLGLFDEVLVDFSAHLRDVEQKAQLIEHRTVEAADGQARLQIARTRANNEIGACLYMRHLAADAQAFMRQVWAEKLTFILLREHDAEMSAAWVLAAKLAWDLAWSMGLHTEQAEHDRLHDTLPNLRAELRAGLDELQAYGRHDNERIFAQICDWQDLALAKPVLVAGDVAMPAPDVPTLPVPAAEEEALTEEMQEMVDLLGGLPFDTWFEFAATETTRQRRLKLAWYSKISSNYMFVDAMGVKVVEFNWLDLARMMCAEQARLLPQLNKPFLERALETILTWVGRTKTETMA